MPAPIIASAARVRLLWTLDGQIALNIIGAQVIGSVTIDQGYADRVGGAIKTQLGTSGLLPLLATTTVLERVGFRDLRISGGVEFLDGSITVPGTGVGDPLPRQTALVITHRTSHASRSGRGRTYFGGFTEAQNDATGAAAAAVATAISAFWSAMGSVLNGEGLTPGVIQNPSPEIIITKTINPGLPNEETQTRHYAARDGLVRGIVQNEVRDLQWDTQRRRNNGRGSGGIAALRPATKF